MGLLLLACPVSTCSVIISTLPSTTRNTNLPLPPCTYSLLLLTPISSLSSSISLAGSGVFVCAVKETGSVRICGQVGTSLLLKLCLNVITNAIIVNINMLTVNVNGEDSKVFTVNDTKTAQAHLYGNYRHILINASKVTNGHPVYVIIRYPSLVLSLNHQPRIY